MIWLIGSQGFIGKEISKKFDENKYNWVGTNNEVDISNTDSLESFAQSIKKDNTLRGKLRDLKRKQLIKKYNISKTYLSSTSKYEVYASVDASVYWSTSCFSAVSAARVLCDSNVSQVFRL